jgi:hypothetical protein
MEHLQAISTERNRLNNEFRKQEIEENFGKDVPPEDKVSWSAFSGIMKFKGAIKAKRRETIFE